MSRSLFRDEFSELVRQPSSGRARIVSGVSTAAASTLNQNIYAPCGEVMPWQAVNDYSQPNAATLLSHIVPALGSVSVASIYGYFQGMIKTPLDDATTHAPNPTSPLWDGTFPNLNNGGPTINPVGGAYFWYFVNSLDLFLYFGGINKNIGGEQDQIPGFNNGAYNQRLRSLSVRVINGRVYWLIGLVDTAGYIAGCWYKICGFSPAGTYTLVTGMDTPPGTVISDWPDYNGLFNSTSGPTFYMHPSTDPFFPVANQITQLRVVYHDT